MDGVIHTTLLTSALFLSSLLPQASPSATLSPFPTIGQEAFHVVEENESLTDIAKEEYNDPEKITILLEDNPWIENANIIQPGWQIRIRKNPLLNTIDPTVHIATPSAQVKEFESMVTPVVQSVTAFASASAFPTPPAVPATPASSYTGGPLTDEQLTYLGSCEAGMDPTRNTGNGYYGAFQFSYGTWKSMGTGYERADLAPLEVQKDAVQRLLSRSSIFTQFPACARKMQSIGLL